MPRSVRSDCKMSMKQVKYSTADGGGADLQIDDPRESGAFGIDGMTGLEAYFCEECGLVRL